VPRPSPIARWRARAARRFSLLARRAARRAGFHLVRADFYSPIPDTDAVPASAWAEPSPMPGLDLDLDAQVALLEGPLAPLLAQFRPPRHAASGYFFDNAMYGLIDAAVLWALVRSSRPATVLEIGAGFSSLVVDAALAANGAGEHRVVDPYPSPLLAQLRPTASVRALPATDVPLEEFAALRAGDVLFVDTTHTVRIAGDVLYLLLQAVPALAPGVLVHVHDVFRPYEYPRFFFDEVGVVWQEHYLLQALLAFNDRFEVVCANHALWRERRPALDALIPGLAGFDQGPSGFWFRRTDVPL